LPVWLIPGFFGTALLYASVGFGGGSTYSALLALAGTDYRILPIVTLACNIVVVTGGTIRFARAGEMPWRPALAVSLVAAPLAFPRCPPPVRVPDARRRGAGPVGRDGRGSRLAGERPLPRRHLVEERA